MSSKKRYTNFCFTAWEDTNEIVGDPPAEVRYWVWEWEIAPSSGRRHQQGYVEFWNAKTIAGASKTLGGVCVEPALGDAQTNTSYCSGINGKMSGRDAGKPKRDIVEALGWPVEDGDYIPHIFGEPAPEKSQGKRNDIINYLDAIDNGADELELASREDTRVCWGRHERLYGRYKQLLEKNKEKPMPCVFVFHGKAGCGKSRTAHIIGEYLGSVYTMTGNYKWWEDYENQNCIVMDDYEGQLQKKDLLQLLDRYKCKREKKNGTVYINSPYIFLTCNDIDWISCDAVKRRILKMWDYS